ncbi:Spastin [Strongyloides ratti]|uniref:microtubule-severing ATPase n=1 Tax=Strongyloides ratti TaxID=34506 RepID=A0A090MZR1_STRRB|nr:Spastin [Strongyloides ratti]CEF69374.1 Spastin [Strongyloides ratti]
MSLITQTNKTYPYYEKFKVDVSTARETLSAALSIDEKNEDLEHKKEAIAMYELAIRQFRHCLNLNLAGRYPPSLKPEIENTKNILAKHISQTRNRVTFLRKMVNGDTSTTQQFSSTRDMITNEGKNLLLKGVNKKFGEMLLETVIESTNVKFSDVAGNEYAKRALEEAVILPYLNPSLFTGLRNPTKGILLFGPPGNGKTMLAKAVANESKCIFFNISAGDLTSKWVGESEKIITTLFSMARNAKSAVIFIDEIDSILCERSNSDSEVGRRMKTQFLIQFDGCATDKNDRVLVIAATNRPFELDEAIIRRFPKRIFIDLPNEDARMNFIKNTLEQNRASNGLSITDLRRIARATDMYTNADLIALCSEAAMVPLRNVSRDKITKITQSQIRPITFSDFCEALKVIRPSTNRDNLAKLVEFAKNSGQMSSNSTSARSVY